MTASTLFAKGSRINYSNTGSAIVAGDLVAIVTGASGMVGIAVTAIPATTGTGELAIGGADERLWTCPKAGTEAFTLGQVLYFDGTQLSGTNTTTSTRAGRAGAAATTASTSCVLILNQP